MGTAKYSVVLATKRLEVAVAVGFVPTAIEQIASVWMRTKAVFALRAFDWTEPAPMATVCSAIGGSEGIFESRTNGAGSFKTVRSTTFCVLTKKIWPVLGNPKFARGSFWTLAFLSTFRLLRFRWL